MKSNVSPVNPYPSLGALSAFQTALNRESHVLSRHPDLLWQQLYNRLQWEEEPVPGLLEPQLRMRTGPGTQAWIRTRTPAQESEALVRTMEAHDKGITACDFSPDSSQVATASVDHRCIIWDLAKGQPTAQLTTPHRERGLTSCAFSPDGSLLASGTLSGRVWIWLAETEEVIHTGFRHERGVFACAFNPDGTKLATAGVEFVRIWDLATHAAVCTVRGHSACAFSPDGAHLLSPGPDNTLGLWDSETGARIRIFRGHTKKIQDCAFGSDGKRVASASSDKTLKVWNAETAEEIRTFRGHDNPHGVVACSIGPAGSRILSTGFRTARLWDIETGKEISRFHGHSSTITTCEFSQDGRRVVTGSADGTAKIWNPNPGLPVFDTTGHQSWIESCDFSFDGSQLITGSLDGTSKVWCADTLKLIATLENPVRVQTCRFTPDGSSAISASDADGICRIWDISNGREIQDFGGSPPISISPDGTLIASAGPAYTCKIWDVKSRKARAILQGHSGSVKALAFDPAGSRLASAGDKTLRLWNTVSGEEMALFECPGGWMEGCVFSPDGARLASTSSDGSLRLWDISTGQELYTVTGRSPFGFSPDGSRLVCALPLEGFEVFNSETGTLLSTLRVAERTPLLCAFSSDGYRVITASGYRRSNCRVWDPVGGVCLAMFPLQGELRAMAVHPYKPFIACGDDGGSIVLLDIMGPPSGLPIVTAFKDRDGLGVRCPGCSRSFAVPDAYLSQEVSCPNPNCREHLRVGSLVVGSSETTHL